MNSQILVLQLVLLWSFSLYAQENKPFYYAPELFNPSISGSVCGFSSNGKVIYFIREDTVKRKLFIYKAKWKANKWMHAQLMPFSGIYQDIGGRLTADGKTFYFTSDRPGGSERADDVWNIWVSHLVKNRWSEPEPLTEINNRGLECCAVPVSRDEILFSTDRGQPVSWWIGVYNTSAKTEHFIDSLNGVHSWQWPSSFPAHDILLLNSMRKTDNYGMDDIYISFRQNGQWTFPVNLGGPVNTHAYEDGAILSPDKRWLIYCQHDTHETPSKVMAVEWSPILDRLKKGLKNPTD